MLIGVLLLLATNTQWKKRKRKTYALFFDRPSCKEYLTWINFHVAKNFRVGISRKLAQSKMFRNGHWQKWMHAKCTLKNLTKILKMDTQWFQPWVNLNGLSVIYLLCLNTKNQQWLFTFGQTPIFVTDWENRS